MRIALEVENTGAGRMYSLAEIVDLFDHKAELTDADGNVRDLPSLVDQFRQILSDPITRALAVGAKVEVDGPDGKKMPGGAPVTDHAGQMIGRVRFV